MSKMIYTGAFVSTSLIGERFIGTLSKTIANQHVTFAFKPSIDIQDVINRHLGEDVRITAIGYGNNGENEGLKVRVESESEELNKLIEAIDIPHITISVGENGKPVNTAKLEFKDIPSFTFTGKIGFYDGREVVV